MRSLPHSPRLGQLSAMGCYPYSHIITRHDLYEGSAILGCSPLSLGGSEGLTRLDNTGSSYFMI